MFTVQEVIMKKLAATLLICSSLLLAGCSAGDAVDQLTSNSSKTTATPAAPTATPGPTETNLSLKEKGTIGDWEVNVKKVAVKRKIKNGKYRYFQAGKGKTYAVFTVTVKNNGKKDAAFLPRVGLKNQMVQALLTNQKETEYKPTQLLSYDKDIVTKTIPASSQKTGIITFEIPKKDGQNKKDLKLVFDMSKEKLLYSIA